MFRFRWSVLVDVGVLFAICSVYAQNETSSSNTTVNLTGQSGQDMKFSKIFKDTNLLNSSGFSENAREVISQIISRKCSHQYSITCLKIDLNKLIDKLVTTKNFQILPGISLVSTYNMTVNKTDMPVEVAVSLVRSNNNNSELNSYLLEKIGKYVGSLSVRVNLLDNPIIQNLKDFTQNTITDFFNPIEETGRSKKTGKQDMHAAIWTAAMLAALGFSGLAALAGKAMLTGALALVLSLVCLLRGCGRSGAAHYEIITKPAHLHDVEHLSYPGTLGTAPYSSYARRLIQDRIIPALNVLDTDSSDEKELVREVIPVHAYQVPASYNPTSIIHR